MRASACRHAGIPRASQMQLPKYRRSPTSTSKGVGIAENGFAIQM